MREAIHVTCGRCSSVSSSRSFADKASGVAAYMVQKQVAMPLRERQPVHSQIDLQEADLSSLREDLAESTVRLPGTRWEVPLRSCFRPPVRASPLRPDECK